MSTMPWSYRKALCGFSIETRSRAGRCASDLLDYNRTFALLATRLSFLLFLVPGAAELGTVPVSISSKTRNGSVRSHTVGLRLSNIYKCYFVTMFES